MRLVALSDIPNSVGRIFAGQTFEADETLADRYIRGGAARPEVEPPKHWTGLQWRGATVVIMASGQSLESSQCEAVRAWTTPKDPLRRVIAINTTFRRALWADVLYACDMQWWQVHHREVFEQFTGELWTQDERAKRAYEIKHIESVPAAGLGKRPGVIHQGSNSGYQAINLAYQAGAARIVLLGFDFHGTHWHGKHASGLPNPQDWLFDTWIRKAEQLALDLKLEGVDVVNCSQGSALSCFRMGDLSGELR